MSSAISKLDTVLRQIYYDPAATGSYGTAWSLYKSAKQSYPTETQHLTLAQVQAWLQVQHTNQLHTPSKIDFPRRRVRVRNCDEQWQGDLAFMLPLAPYNSGIKYIMLFIDVLSKYMWAEPMRDKSGATSAAAFQAILDRASPRVPAQAYTDHGSEFLAWEFKELCAKHRIKQYFAQNAKTKASIAERGVRTLMTPLAKYITANGKRYVNVLQDFVDRYNSTVHHSIKMKPKDVNPNDPKTVAQAWNALYGTTKAIDGDTLFPVFKFAVGDKVRIVISRVGDPFYKGYTVAWQDGIYVIDQQLPTSDRPTYTVRDPISGARLIGTYYEQELLPVKEIEGVATGPFTHGATKKTSTRTYVATASEIRAAAKKSLQSPSMPKTTRTGKVYGLP